jgi:CBS domain-containing protein
LQLRRSARGPDRSSIGKEDQAMASKIREVMSTRLVTLDRKASAAEAARLMREEDVGDVLVLSGGKLCGIVTDRDIVVRCVAEGSDVEECTVDQICSEELETLSPGDPIDHAVDLMKRKAVRRVPIVESGRPVGIVSLGDLAIDRSPKSALGEISTAPPNT